MGKIMLFQMSLHVERLPSLFFGYPRRATERSKSSNPRVLQNEGNNARAEPITATRRYSTGTAIQLTKSSRLQRDSRGLVGIWPS